MTKVGEAPGKSWARNGGISDPLARAVFNAEIIPPQGPPAGLAGPHVGRQATVWDLPRRLRQGPGRDARRAHHQSAGRCASWRGDWAISILDHALEYRALVAMPPEGSAMRLVDARAALHSRSGKSLARRDRYQILAVWRDHRTHGLVRRKEGFAWAKGFQRTPHSPAPVDGPWCYVLGAPDRGLLKFDPPSPPAGDIPDCPTIAWAYPRSRKILDWHLSTVRRAAPAVADRVGRIKPGGHLWALKPSPGRPERNMDREQ
jgi:hypothetical protein